MNVIKLKDDTESIINLDEIVYLYKQSQSFIKIRFAKEDPDDAAIFTYNHVSSRNEDYDLIYNHMNLN